MSDETLAEPRVSVTIALAIAAACGALIAIFGDKSGLGPVTIGGALIGLAPWALDAGGVRINPVVFLVSTIVPAAAIVLIDRNPGGTFPLMLTIVAITRSSASRTLVASAVGLAVATIIGLAILERTTHRTGMVYFLGGLGVAWLAGSMMRRQEVLVAELQAANARQFEHAAAAERTRIAREVHDVVAHSLSVTMLHVTGARRVLAHDPGRAAEALMRAEDVGRESLDSIRQVVGLLRHGDNDASGAAPLPAIGDIPGLVEQYRSAGLHVVASLTIDDIDIDPATSLTAYRVVQEALSNVLQHSPGSSVDLSVGGEGSGSSLRIVAENPTCTPVRNVERVGLGLRGMAERVRAAGGAIEAGLTGRETWRIEAVLPLRPSTMR
jgi:signal transduction histidine kinase